MALTQDAPPARRGPPARNSFGYPVPAGEIVYRGSLIGVNASFQAQRLQTSGTVAFIGVSDGQVDNRLGTAATTDIKAVAELGCYPFTISPAPTASQIGANVYATDDNTLTMNSAATGAVLIGTLAGVENGQPYVQLKGS